MIKGRLCTKLRIPNKEDTNSTWFVKLVSSSNSSGLSNGAKYSRYNFLNSIDTTITLVPPPALATARRIDRAAYAACCCLQQVRLSGCEAATVDQIP